MPNLAASISPSPMTTGPAGSPYTNMATITFTGAATPSGWVPNSSASYTVSGTTWTVVPSTYAVQNTTPITAKVQINIQNSTGSGEETEPTTLTTGTLTIKGTTNGSASIVAQSVPVPQPPNLVG